MSTTTHGSNKIPATLLPGDGIGPEIMDAVIQVLDALGAPFDWDRQQAGMAGIAAGGDPLPAATLDSIRRTKLALKGPLSTPIGGGFRSVNVRLREEFQLFANVRPAHTLVPGGRYDNIDLILVRENLEGLYVAFEHYIPIGDDPHAVAMSSGVNTREGCRRIIRYAFEHALKQGRKKITLVHKANVLKALTGIFLETGQQIAKEYEGRIECNDRIVDACAMQLVMNPWQFDVIVTTNLFGDILSDLIAGLVGGLGAAPGSNIGEKAAIFEAVHGSAPDIAGKGIANPTALLLAVGLMLDHVGLTDHATQLRKAIDHVLNQDKIRTGDLGGKASTGDFARALVQRVSSGTRSRSPDAKGENPGIIPAGVNSDTLAAFPASSWPA
jgi:isocitrate dehydrogenase (NAD+)